MGPNIAVACRGGEKLKLACPGGTTGNAPSSSRAAVGPDDNNNLTFSVRKLTETPAF